MDLSGLRRIFPRVDSQFIEKQLRGSADLEHVERRLQDLLQQNPQPLALSQKKQTEVLSSLLALFGGSSFLSRFALQNFKNFVEIFSFNSLEESKTHSHFSKEILELTKNIQNFEQLCAVLRRYKYEQILRIAVRDIRDLSPIEEIVQEISDLASVCVDAAYRVCRRWLDPESLIQEEFVVIGMGKLGGRELNFSSDIDLIYLYDTQKFKPDSVLNHPGIPKTLHEYFVRLSERITKALATKTEGGFVWRVDLRLRPDGNQGALCHSVSSALTYYESWGHTWERAALFKACPVAGDLEVGERFLQQLEPWLYRRYLDYATVEDIELLKQKIDREVAASGKGSWDLKLGVGGIREIEFFIQTLQLVNAGKNPRMRERNTLRALQIAVEQKVLKESIAELLASAYRFYRKVEHRLQMWEELQTQKLPTSPSELERLARQSGFSDSKSFLSEIESHRQTVQKIFGDLLGASRRSEAKMDPEVERILGEEIPEEELLQWLTNHRFQNSQSALRNLRLLHEGPPFAHFSDKARRALDRLGPMFLKEVIQSPNPDQSLGHLERFVSAIGSRGGIYSLLMENPKTLQLLIYLFGSSVFLSNFLNTHLELLDILVMRGYVNVRKQRHEIEEELQEMLSRFSEKEDRLNALRQFKNGEMLRIAINDLWGELDILEVFAQLSDLAEVVLQQAFKMAQEEMVPRFGEKPNLSVFALGKFGGRELNYHSNLDLIFILPDPTSLPPEAYTRLAQKLISNLTATLPSGSLYKVDTRLRPSGTRGPLVTTLQAFKRYHLEKAAIWEKLALTRLRWVGGDETLKKSVMQVVEHCMSSGHYSESDWSEADRIRGRIEKELAQERTGKYNPKLGRGGLVDIEFLTQRLELESGFAEPNTLAALDRLIAVEALEKTTAQALKEDYLFLRRLENRLRIVTDSSISELPSTGETLEQIARRFGYLDVKGRTPGEQLIQEYRERTQKIRAVYQRFFKV